MVWPILISVAVTPRMSAATAIAGHASSASALSAVTRRIDVPSPVYFIRELQACSAISLSWKHAMMRGSTLQDCSAGVESRPEFRTVIARLDRAIKYAAALRFHH